MGSFGVPELIIIFLVVLLVFGAKRIPEIARGLGRGIREFKDATTDLKRELDIDEPTTPARRVEAPRQAATPRTDSPAQRQQEVATTPPPDVEDQRSQV